MALIFFLLPMLLSSLLWLAEAPTLIFLLLHATLCLLPVDREALARRCGEAEVLVFDLVAVAKALVHFEHSSEVLVFDLDASLEAAVQFEQATEVDEAFLERRICLHLDCFVVAFGHAVVATLPFNMVDAGLHHMVSSIVGDVTSLRVIPSRNL